ncbi:MAG TPA: hypothetical protein VFG03_15995 [Telluria sp.]|nr:hypothetical protein [Telluria sp.]
MMVEEASSVAAGLNREAEALARVVGIFKLDAAQERASLAPSARPALLNYY